MIKNPFIDGDVYRRAAIAAVMLRLHGGTKIRSGDGISTFTDGNQSRKLRAAVALRIVKVLESCNTLSVIVCRQPAMLEKERRTAIAVIGGDFRINWEPLTAIEQLAEWDCILEEYADDHAPEQPFTEELVKRLKKYGECYA